MNARDKKYLLTSIALHVAVIVILTVKVYFFPMERPEFIRAVRVDLVALPDKDPEEGPQGVEKSQPIAKAPEPEKKKEEPVKLPPEKPKAAKAEPKKKEPKEAPKKDAPKEDSKTTKDQQSDALKRLQTLANLKKKMSEVKKEGPEGKEYKGNEVSEGNSLTGIKQLQYDKYLAMLDQHIKKNWQLPEWMSQKDLKVYVLVRFDDAGAILEKRVSRSSGDPAFDREALNAVTVSAPFPIPPENLVSYFKVRGIELRFPE